MNGCCFYWLGNGPAIKTARGLSLFLGYRRAKLRPSGSRGILPAGALLILTADRPAEWIEQQDGQTLNQREIYGKHVKASYELPADDTHADAHWHAERILNEAINLAGTFPQGPVHINVPLREPLYPKAGESPKPETQIKLIRQWNPQAVLSPEQWVEIREIWEDSPRKLIVAGQHPYHPELIEVLRQIQTELGIAVVGDIITNLHSLPDACRYADAFLMRTDEKAGGKASGLIY